MENTSSTSTKNKKVKENEFQKILNDDKVIKTTDDYVKKSNELLMEGFESLAFGDGSEEEKKKLISAIVETQKEIEKGFMMRHHYIMAQYAKFKNDESPESPAHNTYW